MSRSCAPVFLGLSLVLVSCSDDLQALQRTGPSCPEITCGMYEFCVDDGLAATCDCLKDYVRCAGVCIHETATCGLPGVDGGVVDGGASRDGGLSTEATGSVSGVVLLEGMNDHAGTTVRILTETAVTTSDGRFVLSMVPIGSHTLRVEHGPVPETASVSGRVHDASGRVDLDEVHAFLQVFPTTWDPVERSEIAVFEGRETTTNMITLRRTATYVSSSSVDPDGRYTLENVPVGTFAAPATFSDDHVLGTYGMTAADDYDLRPAQLEGPRNVGLGFASDTDHYAFADPEDAHTGPLVVDRTTGGTLPDVALYRYEPLDMTEAAFTRSGYDFAGDTSVPADVAGADFRLVDSAPLQSPANILFRVEAAAPNQVVTTGSGTLSSVRRVPASGYGATAPLSLGHDDIPAIARDVFVFRLDDGSHVKARFYLHSTSIINGYRRVRVQMLFHHEPAGRTTFGD